MQYAPRGDVTTALSCFSPERRAGVIDMTLIAKSPSERVSTLSINRLLCTASLLFAFASSPPSHLLIHITCLTASLFLISIHLGDSSSTIVRKESRVHIFQVCHHPPHVSDCLAKLIEASSNLVLSRRPSNTFRDRHTLYSKLTTPPTQHQQLNLETQPRLKQQTWTRQLRASLQRFTSATRALHMSSSPKSLACS